MGKRLEEPSHKRNVEKTLVKCTKWHVEMLGKDFDYKRAFCYAWKDRDSKGRVIMKGKTVNVQGRRVETGKKKPVWNIKVYDVVEHHEMFVQRGVWTPSR